MAHPATRTKFIYDPDLADGVYLNLSHQRYFRQRCMGSSDWTDLARLKHGWWWKSRNNPFYRAPTNPYQTYGSALHILVLEGVSEYERLVVIEPTRGDYPAFDLENPQSLADTIAEMKAVVGQAGYNVAAAKGYDKQRWADTMRQCSGTQDWPCWKNIEDDFEAEAGTRLRVTAASDFEMRFLREMALSEDRPDNAHVRRLFRETADHPPLVEVSIFATVDGIRRRWRIDRFFPAANMDLKSLGLWSGRPLNIEAGDTLAKRRWSIQRADYDVGRENAYRLVREGQVFGGTLEQVRYLQWIVDEEPKWDWVWMIYQKPDSAKGTAPVIMPVWGLRGLRSREGGPAQARRRDPVLQVDDRPMGPRSPLGHGRAPPLHRGTVLRRSSGFHPGLCLPRRKSRNPRVPRPTRNRRHDPPDEHWTNL